MLSGQFFTSDLIMTVQWTLFHTTSGTCAVRSKDETPVGYGRRFKDGDTLSVFDPSFVWDSRLVTIELE